MCCSSVPRAARLPSHCLSHCPSLFTPCHLLLCNISSDSLRPWAASKRFFSLAAALRTAAQTCARHSLPLEMLLAPLSLRPRVFHSHTEVRVEELSFVSVCYFLTSHRGPFIANRDVPGPGRRPAPCRVRRSSPEAAVPVRVSAAEWPRPEAENGRAEVGNLW